MRWGSLILHIVFRAGNWRDILGEELKGRMKLGIHSEDYGR